MAGLTGAHTYSQVWKPSALLASQSFTSYLSLEAWTDAFCPPVDVFPTPFLTC